MKVMTLLCRHQQRILVQECLPADLDLDEYEEQASQGRRRSPQRLRRWLPV